MTKVDRRDIKKMYRNAQRRSRFGRVGRGLSLPGTTGSGYFLPGTTGGQLSRPNGRVMSRMQMRNERLKKGDMRGYGLFSNLFSGFSKKASKTVTDTASATKKLVEQQAKDTASDLAQDMSNMALRAIGGGGPSEVPKQPPNREQVSFMKKFAERHPNQAMPSLGGAVKDQDRLRNLILGGAKPKKKRSPAKRKPKKASRRKRPSGRGLIYV